MRRMKVWASILLVTVAFLALLFASIPIASAGPFDVCEIVETGVIYSDLGSALAAVSDGQTIKLLVDIEYEDQIYIWGYGFTLELDGHFLNVYDDDCPLYVADGYLYLNDSAGGQLNVWATGEYGVAVEADYGSHAEVTHASGHTGASAYRGSTIEVMGNIEATRYGAYANALDAQIIVHGYVQVKSESSGNYYGVYAWEADVTVYGDVIVDVTATNSDTYINGVFAADNSATVYGSVTVIVVGDATDICGVSAVNAATIFIGGDVSVSGGADWFCGAYAGGSSRITIDGDLTVPAGAYFILFDTDESRGPDEFSTPSSKPGYFEYTDGTGNFVWIKEPSEPEPVEYEIIEGDGQYWIQGSADGMNITCNGEYFLFEYVLVDGKAVDSKQVTTSPGSTIAYLTPEFLNTLALGWHTIEFVYVDGSATGTFRIVAADPADPNKPLPPTGDATLVSSVILMGTSSLIMLGGAALVEKKREAPHK